MPPAAVKTVRDLIFWQYAKIISDSAGLGKRSWRFVMDRFKRLQQGDIFWNEIREYVKEHERDDACIFCGDTGPLAVDHMIPRSMQGPNDEKNVIMVCRSCNSQKGARRLYEWYTLKGGVRAAKYDVPRIAEGKYLKLIYEVLERDKLLDLSVSDLQSSICPRCDLQGLCSEQGTAGKLSPLCLDGMATLCLRGSGPSEA